MQSLRIKNYKNLRDFKIDTLSRVNLIVGKNNVGKSTLLEAIAIYAAEGSISCLKDILDIRGETTRFRDVENALEREIDSLSSLYSNRDTEAFLRNPIEISTDDRGDLFNDKSIVSIKLVKYIETFDPNSEGELIRRRHFLESDEELASDEPDAMIGILSLYNSKKSLYRLGRNLRQMSSNSMIACHYVRTSQISSNLNPQLFDNIALSPLEKEIINTLRIIEPRIDAINFLKDNPNSYRENDRVPFVVFTGSTQRYKLSSMGDGVNRILTIILALLNCKGGVLLIDEIDNGLHYTVQTQLWQIIFELADKLNVQVFATTHSDDCIKSFVKADKNEGGELIRLENRGGEIVAVEYEEQDELDYIANNEIEIR